MPNPFLSVPRFGISRLFSKEQAGLVYDALYKAMCIVPLPPPMFSTNDGHEELEKPETRIGLRMFRLFWVRLRRGLEMRKML